MAFTKLESFRSRTRQSNDLLSLAARTNFSIQMQSQS